MTDTRRNVAASVHDRLLRGAHARVEDFNLTLQRYAAERMLYRLGASPYRARFVLKGAMLFALWRGFAYRATPDLDLTGFIEGDADTLVAIIQDICAVPCEDGLVFHAGSVRVEPIRDKSEVADDGSIVGTERDQLETDDTFMRHLAQVVRNGLGDRAGTCVDPKTQIVQDKTVCVVSCQRSPEPVFLKWKNLETSPEGDFYVRSGPGTGKLAPESAREYVRTRFHPMAS